jgi:hypothetical protein
MAFSPWERVTRNGDKLFSTASLNFWQQCEALAMPCAI